MAKTPTKKTTAKKTTKKAAAKKPVKKTVKKAAAKKTVKKAAAKTTAKKPAAKKKTVKKAVAKKTAAKRPAAKKPAVKKVVKKTAKKGAPRKRAKASKVDDRWAEIRDQLEGRRTELVGEARRTIDDSLSQEKEQMAEIGDRATEEIDDTFQARLKGREAKLIAKIDETLGRIARGEYGLCESCGEEIAYKRLLARPVATLCIDCKTAQERQEKNFRS